MDALSVPADAGNAANEPSQALWFLEAGIDSAIQHPLLDAKDGGHDSDNNRSVDDAQPSALAHDDSDNDNDDDDAALPPLVEPSTLQQASISTPQTVGDGSYAMVASANSSAPPEWRWDDCNIIECGHQSGMCVPVFIFSNTRQHRIRMMTIGHGRRHLFLHRSYASHGSYSMPQSMAELTTTEDGTTCMVDVRRAVTSHFNLRLPHISSSYDTTPTVLPHSLISQLSNRTNTDSSVNSEGGYLPYTAPPAIRIIIGYRHIQQFLHHGMLQNSGSTRGSRTALSTGQGLYEHHSDTCPCKPTNHDADEMSWSSNGLHLRLAGKNHSYSSLLSAVIIERRMRMLQDNDCLIRGLGVKGGEEGRQDRGV